MSTLQIIALAALLLAAAVLVWIGYRRRLPWTGFVERRALQGEDEVVIPAKTLWDWLQLLIVPIGLVVVGVLFNAWQTDRDALRAEERAVVDREIALDGQRERELQDYLDEMSGLILDRGLRTAPLESEVADVARTRTLSTLRRLDGERKGAVLQFLAEAGLIESEEPIVWLKGADLRGTILQYGSLGSLDLREVDFRDSILNRVTFASSIIGGSNFSRACLREVSFHGAFIGLANFSQADLSGANFDFVEGSEPVFYSANLMNATGQEMQITDPWTDRAILDGSVFADLETPDGASSPYPPPNPTEDRCQALLRSEDADAVGHDTGGF